MSGGLSDMNKSRLRGNCVIFFYKPAVDTDLDFDIF